MIYGIIKYAVVPVSNIYFHFQDLISLAVFMMYRLVKKNGYGVLFDVSAETAGCDLLLVTNTITVFVTVDEEQKRYGCSIQTCYCDVKQVFFCIDVLIMKVNEEESCYARRCHVVELKT
ncbi:hypothetical protein KUTeg_015968 [Tegillarca granosa]|uniref:Uncharacterized protein n=1 Tax=Tegillarca granosa TaxID=220873 RepID=A0ABQ9EJH6_TEGGR|nr:hypothetical protein KUTeg_015968 [Tegillarca granosa]